MPSSLLLARKIDIVYGPLVDAQEFPEEVDVTLVEGAVSSQDDLNKMQKIRQRTQLFVALGDCAVTGNVPAMRNYIPVNKLLQRMYLDGSQEKKLIPNHGVPAAVEACAPAPRIRQGRFMFARLSASRQGILGVITIAEGKKAEAGQSGEIRIRSA